MAFRTLVIANRKGGVGKTNISTNLAVAADLAGETPIIVDIDQQASSAKWSKYRGSENPVVVACPATLLAEILKKAEVSGVTFAIIDTAPNTESDVLDAARRSDMVLVPCKSGRVDLDALTSTVNAIRLAKKPARIVFNQVRPRGDRFEQASEAVRDFKIPIAPCHIGDRVAFEDAFNAGLGVLEYEPRGKASEEIQMLYSYILGEMTNGDGVSYE
jgi:chromosome partitioning protein